MRKMSRKQRKYFGKRKKRPVGYYKKPRKAQNKAVKRRRRRNSGVGAGAAMVGLGTGVAATVGTLALFNKTDFIANDTLSKKIGISAATPAGVVFWGAGWAAGNRHPIAQMAFKGVGIGLVVTDLARVLLSKFGVILAKPDPTLNVIDAPAASPAPAAETARPAEEAQSARTQSPVQTRGLPVIERVRMDPETVGARQAFGINSERNSIASLLSLKRRAA